MAEPGSPKATQQERLQHVPELPPPPFKVRLHPRTENELAVGRLLERLEELHWFIAEYRALEHWPLDDAGEQRLAETLGLVRHTCENDVIYEATFEPASQAGPLSVFFWVCAAQRTVWILHVCETRSPLVQLSKRRRACSRLRELKGYYHDLNAEGEHHADRESRQQRRPSAD